MNSFRIGMNSFRIKLSKGTILPFSFLLQLRLGNWKLCFLILSLHKKFYFLTLFTTPNSSIYPEWFHSGSEWIHSVLEWIHTVPEYIHSGLTFLIVLYDSIKMLSQIISLQLYYATQKRHHQKLVLHLKYTCITIFSTT